MSGQTCIITGGSRGIGLATGLRFAREGWNVVIAGRREDTLRGAAKEICNAGAACEAVAADAGTAAGAERIVAAARARFGGVSALVNNVGDALLGPIGGISDEAFELAVRANIGSVFYMTRAVWRIFESQRDGVVVSLSSLASVDPFPGFSVYGGCKAWINTFTRAMAEEGRAAGIRVLAVAPGAVETDMLRGAFPDFPAAQTLAPEAVADLIFALTGATWRHATGQTLFIRK